MSVRYKFKNDLEFNAVPCDGFHISVLDLKRTIIRAKRLGRITDFDLQITNQQTGEVYSSEDDLIPKNSTLIIVRVPLSAGQKKIWEAEKLPQASGGLVSSSSDKTFTASSSSTDGASEEDKISSMMSTSAEMYDRKNWVVYRGKAAFPGKPPPITYRCNRCHQTGHWVQDCALIKAGVGGQELKKTTGIPRSFLKPANIDTPGVKIDSQGMYMVNELETQAYRDKKVDKPVWDSDSNVSSATVNLEIPSDLKCPVCHDLLKDAIMLPTCACATCDECARNALIESDNNACPVCNEPDNCPDDLIPCRKLRDKVNKFKNTSGYAAKSSAAPHLMSPKNNATPTLPDIVLPNQFDLIRDGNKAAPQKENTPPSSSSLLLSSVVTSGDPPSYSNSPYANISEDAATPLTSEPPIPGVVDNDDEHDVFKSKAPPQRSPETSLATNNTSATTPATTTQPMSPNRTPSPPQMRKSPRSSPPPQTSSRSPPSIPHHPSTYSNGLSIPVSLPDTSLPPPGFMGSLPTYLPPPMSRYGVPPHNPAFRPHHPHMPIPNRFPGGRRDQPPSIPGQQNFIEDPLETFNRLMAQKDQKKKYHRSRSRSPSSHYHRHSPSRRSYRQQAPSPIPPPPPRGPRTPPLSPRVSSTPPPGDSPHHHHHHHHAPLSESPRSGSPPRRHHSPRRRSPPSPRHSPNRRRSHSPRRYSRSRSRSPRSGRSPPPHDYHPRRGYYDEDRYSRRSYHSNEPPRYRDNSNYNNYRDDYYRSSRSSRVSSRGKTTSAPASRGGRSRGYYERRSSPPHHQPTERSRRDQRSYSAERTPSLSPEPETHQSQRFYNSNYPSSNNHHHSASELSRDYSQQYQHHHESSEGYHHGEDNAYDRRKADKYASSANKESLDHPSQGGEEEEEEEDEEPPVIVKKKKEKKKKRKKEDSGEVGNEPSSLLTEDSKRKKKKAKKVKTKSDVNEDRPKKKSLLKEESKDKSLESNHRYNSVEHEVPASSCSPRKPKENEEEEEKSSSPSALAQDEEENDEETKDVRQGEMIELVPELSKWEREDLVADSSTSPIKERGGDHRGGEEDHDYEDSSDLRDVLKNKKGGGECGNTSEDNVSSKKKKKSSNVMEATESEDGTEPRHLTESNKGSEENEELKKKKKKKKKQKEMAKKIEKKLRKEMKKKLKEKLKRKKNRESTTSPIHSPSPPPHSKDHHRRSRDVKSERGDGLKITIDRNQSGSRSPSMERKRRSTSEEEFNRNRASLLKLSGTDVRDSKSNNNNNSIQPSRKLSIKDRLGPIKRSRSRSPALRRSHGRRRDSSKERRRFDDSERNPRDYSKNDSRSNQIHSVASDSRRKSDSRRSRERDGSDKKRRRSPSSPSKDSKRNKDNWGSSSGGPAPPPPPSGSSDYLSTTSSSSKRGGGKKRESSSRGKDDSSEKSRKNRKNSSSKLLKSRYDSEIRNNSSRGYNSDSN